MGPKGQIPRSLVRFTFRMITLVRVAMALVRAEGFIWKLEHGVDRSNIKVTVTKKNLKRF